MSVPDRGSARRLTQATLLSAFALAMAVPVSNAEAQLPPIKNKRPVRRAVIDLEKMALENRPGQVVPEDVFPPVEVVKEGAAPTAALAAAGTTGGEVTTWPSRSTPAQPPSERPASPSDSTLVVPQAGSSSPAPSQLDQARGAEPSLEEQSIPPAANGEPIGVIVLAAKGADSIRPQVQWRPIGGDEASWRPAGTGARAEERIEVRTGLDGSVTLEIDGLFAVQIDRLTRLRIERRRRDDVSELSIELIRGRAEVRPIKVDQTGLAVEPVRIRTPDATLLRRSAVGVTFDAFKGTRETPLSQR
ncbi:MAG: hypothetical protein KF745_07440 [Phycisphaeraceae bacterium]|nr:hypothetical protein [Phycisphaeraceae bacterium]